MSTSYSYNGCIRRDFRYNDELADLDRVLKRVAFDAPEHGEDLSAPKYTTAAAAAGDKLSFVWDAIKGSTNREELFKNARKLRHMLSDTIEDNVREGDNFELKWNSDSISGRDCDKKVFAHWRAAARARDGMVFLTNVLKLVGCSSDPVPK
jgi:hypothetical protein